MDHKGIYVLTTTESLPFFKYGGLGDYCRGFSRALVEHGWSVRVYMPYYEHHTKTCFEPKTVREHSIEFKGRQHTVKVYEYQIEGVQYCLVRARQFFGEREIFKSDCPIYNENLDWLSFFGIAVVEDLDASHESPTVLQGNDWYSSLLFLNPKLRQRFNSLRTILMIHNAGMHYRGVISKNDPRNLDPRLANHTIQSDSTWLAVIAGLVDKVGTVSQVYAQQLVDDESRLGSTLASLSNDGRFSGFLNGMDLEYWQAFSRTKMTMNPSIETLKGGLTIGFVGRISKEKGLDFLSNLVSDLPEIKRLYVLGEGQSLNAFFDAETLPKVKHYSSYSDALCAQFMASLDVLIVPSYYEPCGLVAVHACRFGCLPLVRDTGGLREIGAKIQRITRFNPTWKTLDELVQKLKDLKSLPSRYFSRDLEKLDWPWMIQDIEEFVLKGVPQCE